MTIKKPIITSEIIILLFNYFIFQCIFCLNWLRRIMSSIQLFLLVGILGEVVQHVAAKIADIHIRGKKHSI